MCSVIAVNKLTVVAHNGLRFCVMDSPTDQNAKLYIAALKRKGCCCIVRTCEVLYRTEPFEAEGIKVIDMPFPDGGVPSVALILQWLNLVRLYYPKKSEAKNKPNRTSSPTITVTTTTTTTTTTTPTTTITKTSTNTTMPRTPIAIHCVAGLGRAPLLVGIAMIEAGLAPLDALTLMRKRRPGCINQKQIEFLQAYRPMDKQNAVCLPQPCVIL
jgi:protein tyrosine phosphatase type IVA